MIEKKIDGHKIVFYDSIEDLPISQFHKYSKYILVENGIGDSIQDIDRHISRIINFLGDTKKAYQELLNLRQCLYMVANEGDLSNKAMLCVIKSVDGKDWEDFSESGIEELYRLIRGASLRELAELATDLRKRIDDNLTTYFPNVFEQSSNKNYVDLIRQRALLQVASIAKGEDNEKKIKELTDRIYSLQTPQSFEGANSEEIKFDKQFEDMCLAMAKEFGGGIKKFTTMEFYSAYERLEKQNQELKKIKNRRK